MSPAPVELKSAVATSTTDGHEFGAAAVDIFNHERELRDRLGGVRLPCTVPDAPFIERHCPMDEIDHCCRWVCDSTRENAPFTIVAGEHVRPPRHPWTENRGRCRSGIRVCRPAAWSRSYFFRWLVPHRPCWVTVPVSPNTLGALFLAVRPAASSGTNCSRHRIEVRRLPRKASCSICPCCPIFSRLIRG